MKKERFVDWWKQDKRYMTLLKAVLMAMLPLLCCLVRTAAEGRSIGQVYLPSSEWNDELFYFKQVEGIVNYGFPGDISVLTKVMRCSCPLQHGVRCWYFPGSCGDCYSAGICCLR